jgi:hypothetical protein
MIKNQPTTYAITLLLLQGQVTTQYYVTTASSNQMLLDVKGNKLFDNIVKIDKVEDNETQDGFTSIDTIYVNDVLTRDLNLARLDYYKQIDDKENIAKLEEELLNVKEN